MTAVAVRSFQLVRGIRRVEGSRLIEATTAWTAADRLPPLAFLVEAVAQAGGWLIAAATNFTRRGLPLGIGSVRLFGVPAAGAPLDLVAEVTAWRDTSAQLRGKASSEGRLLALAEGGICGLVPAGQLDDPAATQARYASLLADGWPVDAPGAAAEPPGAPRVEGLEAHRGRAAWDVVGGDDLFADHFPRWPVLPGSYQVQALAELGALVAGAEGGPTRSLVALRHVRFRHPVRRCDRVELEVKAQKRAHDRVILTGRAQVGGNHTTTIGEMEFGPAA